MVNLHKSSTKIFEIFFENRPPQENLRSAPDLQHWAISLMVFIDLGLLDSSIDRPQIFFGGGEGGLFKKKIENFVDLFFESTNLIF